MALVTKESMEAKGKLETDKGNIKLLLNLCFLSYMRERRNSILYRISANRERGKRERGKNSN